MPPHTLSFLDYIHSVSFSPSRAEPNTLFLVSRARNTFSHIWSIPFRVCVCSKRMVDKMSISKRTIRDLDKLCIVLFSEYPKDKYDPEKHRSSLIRDKPKDIEEGGTGVFLYDKYYQLYQRAFFVLRNEKVLEFMGNRELEKEVWHLTCEIILQRPLFSNIGDVKKRVREFSADIAKPFDDYEILVPLLNIDVGDKILDIGDSIIKKYDSDALAEWGILKDTCPPGTFNRFLNKSCFVIKEEGNNGHLACNRAREKSKYLLKLLQVALSSSRVLTDWELLYSIGTEVALRFTGSPDYVGFDWARGFVPIPREIDDKLETDVNSFLDKISPILSDVKYGSNLKKAFINAITWIGRAIEEEDSDLGIIFLSTALESMLTSISDSRKGETIAYRMLLLNTFIEESFTHPSRVLYVYELRSKVIHGSDLYASTKKDYSRMKHVAIETVEYASLAIQKMGIRRKNEFHRELESDKNSVDQIMKWLRDQGDPRSIQIADYMEDHFRVCSSECF